jgi:Sec-independent protein translocase protein TatA
MMRLAGSPEIIIMLGVIVLLLGVGRIGKIASELGSSICLFRAGLTGGESQTEKTE